MASDEDQTQQLESLEAITARANRAAARAKAAADAAKQVENIAYDAASEARDESRYAAAEGHEVAHISRDLGRAEQALQRARAAAETVAAAARQAEEQARLAVRAAETSDRGPLEDAAAGAEEAARKAEKALGEAEQAAMDAQQAARSAEDSKLGAEAGRPAPPSAVHKGPVLLLAEFDTPESCLHAAEAVRDAGYENWDVHTPYPVHGMDDAMGLRPTRLGLISFAAGMLGLVAAVVMIQWMNGFDYPIVVGGKPPDAYPSMVPIMFEMGILLTGFGTFFGLLHLARLPRHHHPVFYSDRFARCSDDRFFVSIEAADRSFDPVKTRALLQEQHPVRVELIEEEQP